MRITIERHRSEKNKGNTGEKGGVRWTSLWQNYEQDRLIQTKEVEKREKGASKVKSLTCKTWWKNSLKKKKITGSGCGRRNKRGIAAEA